MEQPRHLRRHGEQHGGRFGKFNYYNDLKHIFGYPFSLDYGVLAECNIKKTQEIKGEGKGKGKGKGRPPSRPKEEADVSEQKHNKHHKHDFYDSGNNSEGGSRRPAQAPLRPL